jgi:hypothetical protein
LPTLETAFGSRHHLAPVLLGEVLDSQGAVKRAPQNRLVGTIRRQLFLLLQERLRQRPGRYQLLEALIRGNRADHP